jgi:ERCC4-related helicase
MKEKAQSAITYNYLFIFCFQVLVMTPAILLAGLRHSFFKLSMIKVLIIDECHHARGKHPYACIMTVSYLILFLSVSAVHL